MKLYVLKRKDGGVSIMQIMDGFTITQCLAKCPKLLVELTGEYREISPSDLPSDRTDRSKWYDTGTSIGVKE